MRAVAVPVTRPDEVWYWFTPSEWMALPESVRKRIRTEGRLSAGRDIVAIFTATYRSGE